MSASARLRREPPAGRARRELEDALDRRDGGRVDLGGEAGRERELVDVAEQAEAGDVGQRVGARRAGLRRRRRRSASSSPRSPRATSSGEARPRLSAVATVPAPSGLVSTSTSPGPAAARWSAPRRGSTMPVTASPYFGSGSSIECPPTIEAPAAATASSPAAQDLAQDVRAQRLERERDEVQRADRRPAHRVDVRQRVRRRDPPERVRVVDDRREEVDGLHDRERRRVSCTTPASSAVSAATSTRGSVGRGSPATIGRRSAAESLQPQPAPWEREVRGTAIAFV